MLLVTILREKLECILAETADLAALRINDTQFANEEGSDSTGFYDFLRNQDGTIIGIRYFHLDVAPLFLRYVDSKPYARVLANDAIELYFSSDRSYLPERSADQDFGDNMLLRAASGEYAITFGLGGLSTSELNQLRILARRI